MKRLSYEVRIAAIFLALLALYLLLAWSVLAPLGYYGTTEEPRFNDPWFERAETIMNGGLLYRDVDTTTPPLTNYLLIPPVLIANLLGGLNPWATLSFMVYFACFNLLTAYVLLHMAETKETGYTWALTFLLNPLTIGNAVLRRQDESILVFFFALALLAILHQKHWLGSIATGLALLIKLTGGILIPAVFLNTHNWRYLIIPFVIFAVIFLPFYLTAGNTAIFWNVTEHHTEHPFQFGGISLGALWDRWVGYQSDYKWQVLDGYSVAFVIGVALILGWIAWKPKGVLEDFSLLLIAIFCLSPKLHCGYFTFLVLAMTPLLRRYRLQLYYFGVTLLALAADLIKFPLKNYPLSFEVMVLAFIVLIAIAVKLRRPGKSNNRPITAALIAVMLLMVGCSAPAQENSPVSTLPSPTPLPRTFDGELAYTWVTRQCDLGYRVTGTQANYQAGDLFIAELSALGWEVEEQTFNYRETPVRNILAWRGEGPALMIGAHYDSRRAADQEAPSQPVMGANDGASGVAVLLELARALDPEALDNRVYLAFFDAEDNGNLDGWEWIVGSTYMADHWGEGGEPLLTAMVLVDMIGDADQQIYYEHNSNQLLSEEIWAVAATLGYQSRIIPELRHSMLDDHIPFVRKGIPAVDMIDFDYPYWHTLRDTPDKVSPESLESVGRTLEVWIEGATTP